MFKNSYRVREWLRKDEWVAQRMETGKPVEIHYFGNNTIQIKSLIGLPEEEIKISNQSSLSFKALGRQNKSGTFVIYDVLELNNIDLADKPFDETIKALAEVQSLFMPLVENNQFLVSPIFKGEDNKMEAKRDCKFEKWKGLVFKKVQSIKSELSEDLWWQQPYYFHGIAKKTNLNKPELFVLDNNGNEVLIGELTDRVKGLPESAIVEVSYNTVKQGDPIKGKFIEYKPYKNINQVSKLSEIEFHKTFPPISGKTIEQELNLFTSMYSWRGIDAGVITLFCDNCFYGNMPSPNTLPPHFRTNPANTLAYSAYKTLVDDSILSIAEFLRQSIFEGRLPLKIEEMLNDGFVPHRNVIGHPSTTEWDKKEMQAFYDKNRHYLDNQLFMLVDYDLEIGGKGLSPDFSQNFEVIIGIEGILKSSASSQFYPLINTNQIQEWLKKFQIQLIEVYLKDKNLKN